MRFKGIEKEFLKETKDSSKSFSLLFIVFCVVVIGFTFNNYFQLKQNASEMSLKYVDGYTRQVAQGVNNEIYSRLLMFQTLADSLGHTENFDDIEALEGFMNRKSQICNFEFIEYVELDGSRRAMGGEYPTYFRKMGYAELLEQLNKDLLDKGYTVNFENENLYFAVPVIKNDKQVGILWGGNDKTNVLDIINAHVFENDISSLIVSNQGDVVLASNDVLSLNLAQDVQRNDSLTSGILQKHHSGVFEYVDEDTGKNMYFSFHDIGINGWYMVNSVPVEIFSSIEGPFFTQILVALIGVLAMFIGFITLQNLTVRKNSKTFKYLAFNDDVTKGINNNGLKIVYNYLKANGIESEYTIALLDVVNFKLVNEKYGVTFGDRVLMEIYQTIESYLDIDQHEYVSRAETDHFFVLLHETDKKRIERRLLEMETAVIRACKMMGEMKSYE